MRFFSLLLLFSVGCCRVTRLIVTFYSASDARRPWNVSDIAQVHKQYGRRLVLDFNRPFVLSVEKERLLQAIGRSYVSDIEPCGSLSGQVDRTEWDKSVLEPYSMHVPPAQLGSSDVVVAIIDSGISPAGKTVLSHYESGYDFVSHSDTWNDGDGVDADPTDPGDNGTTVDDLTCKASW